MTASCTCGHALTRHEPAGVCWAPVVKQNGIVPCGCHEQRKQKAASGTRGPS